MSAVSVEFWLKDAKPDAVSVAKFLVNEDVATTIVAGAVFKIDGWFWRIDEVRYRGLHPAAPGGDLLKTNEIKANVTLVTR